MATSNSRDLKWLHKFGVIEAEVDGQIISYEVEDFGDCYNGDNEALGDIDEFLASHGSENLDIEHFLLNDVLTPIEYTLRSGVRDLEKSEHIDRLRKKKVIFIVNHVLPRIYHHTNFTELRPTISRALTGLLMLIVELNATHSPDKEEVANMSTYFKAKEFLSSVALQIWSVCLYEQGIPLVEDRTVACLRQLAMLDILDENWNYAGGWEQVMRLLEERHGRLPRIGADRRLDEGTDLIRRARNSIRCQVLELDDLQTTAPKSTWGYQVPQMYSYFPKCSAYMCAEVETSDKPHRLRCYRCHYYHWCSPACQQYSEEVAGHHDMFCEAVPEENAAECRGQMQDYLNIACVNDGNDVNKITCHACGLRKMLSSSMNRCSKCKAVHYCSRTCQAWDWTSGDHKAKCSPPL
jgi:hypothetical protein